MAATLTNDNEILYASFPIEKTETTDDGDLIVYGKASDGGLDSDQQIVDPAWMAKAVQEWLSTGANLRVQHSAQRDPAGIGLEASTDGSGNTYVKGLVIEPVAQKLVSKGALRAYSVGIARPTIVRDGTAPGGRITGGELVEISLVDRPANKRCGIQLVKSENGHAEYTGELFGSEADIAKALGAEIEKSAADMDFTMPDDMSFTFTPKDLAKILKSKVIEQHYDDLAVKAIADAEAAITKRDVNTATRRHLASQGHALPDGSYPIANTEDLHNAAILARSGHGNAEAAKRLIARRAQELGVANPLDADNGKLDDEVTVAKADEAVTPEAAKEADPDVTKDPKKPKKGKKLPPWLNKPAGDDASKADKPMADDEGDDDSDDSCKMDHAHTEKCMPSGTPQSASGAKDAAPMKEMPNPGAYQHSPMPAGRDTPDHKAMGSSAETAAMMRFKSIGIDTDMGRLHDMTCPAFSPDDVAQYHPYSDFASVIDTGMWQRKAVDAACGPMETALAMTQVWQAAETLKGADLADLNDYRLELHKQFRDANPGPVTYPTPGMVTPGQFHRPVITAGHAANSPGYDGPNSSPMVAGGPVTGASGFTRPPLGSGHQSPSPSFMKGGFEYPHETGKPMNLVYAHSEKENARRALSMMHDHLAHAFPLSCPMVEQDPYAAVQRPPVPAAVGKSENAVEAVVPDAVFKAPLDGEVDDVVFKAFKKARKKLGKKVLAGKMTVDEARAKLGRNFAQKDASESAAQKSVTYVVAGDPNITPTQMRELQGQLRKSGDPNTVVLPLAGSTVADENLITAAVTKAIAPLVEKVAAQQALIDANEQRWNTLADQPDPSTVAFTGLALNPVMKTARPAGVPSQADIAERTQQMIMRTLDRTWRTSENPAEREAARSALDKFQGII